MVGLLFSGSCIKPDTESRFVVSQSGSSVKPDTKLDFTVSQSGSCVKPYTFRKAKWFSEATVMAVFVLLFMFYGKS